MESKHFIRAGVLTAFLVVAFILAWELSLRGRGLKVDYDDNAALWASKRLFATKLSPEEATVFIGSSRIKYDLDTETWRKLTGDEPVQLAMEGSTPLPMLDDLAADEKFRGKLVIDVTEGLFFNPSPRNRVDPDRNISFYKKQTPSEKASFRLNRILESQFVFLDRDNFSLNAFLDRLPLPKRDSVFVMPLFPKEFGRNNFDRQRIMMDEFMVDTNLQNQVTGNWKFFASINKTPPPTGALLDSIMASVKAGCDKIKNRGGQIIFVRTPSSGPYWQGEQQAFPREKYWDRLLEVTGFPGIHFKDYPPIANFICPEWSHLSPKDAIAFTQEFVKILEQKGWKFPNKNP
ncbi:MAG TPA: hypothetical protein VEB63_04290 [Chitinophagaceae bacterium]|nr:hypothetical protein [Chitinophagaceae bacterium]